MASANCEAVRRVYDGFVAGDFRISEGLLSPDIVFIVGAGFPDAVTCHGTTEMRAYMREWLRSWEDMRMEPQEIVEAGERVLVKLSQRARGRASGAPTETVYFHVWTFHDAIVARLEVIMDEAEAREAAGLAMRE
jgi:ketosteroid isomerase-like protein